MIEFIIGLLIPISIVTIAFIIYLVTRTKKDTKSPLDSSKNKDTVQANGKRKKAFDWLISLGGILLATIIVFYIFIAIINFFKGCGDSDPENCNYTYVEEFVKIDSGYVDKGQEWVTPSIDYKFRLQSEKNAHGFYIEFTSVNGGWTAPVLIPPHVLKKDIVPPDGTQGPARISAGPNEKNKFKIYLNKKVIVKYMTQERR